MEARRQNAAPVWIVIVLGCAVLFWFVPLFHLRPLQAARAETANAAFNPSAFVEKFWNERLMKSLDQAVDAATLLAEIKTDPKAARAKYGRTVGLSDTYYYFVSGTGRVVSVGKASISLALGSGTNIDIILATGNIFGNAARDATGLLDVNDYPNSQDFNSLASEINRRIEEKVLPGLRARAVVGVTVRFAGCAEIMNETSDLAPLQLVPLRAEFP